MKYFDLFLGDKLIITKIHHGKYQNFQAFDFTAHLINQEFINQCEVRANHKAKPYDSFLNIHNDLGMVQLVHAELRNGVIICTSHHWHVAFRDKNNKWHPYLAVQKRNKKLEFSRNYIWKQSSQKWIDWNSYNNLTKNQNMSLKNQFTNSEFNSLHPDWQSAINNSNIKYFVNNLKKTTSQLEKVIQERNTWIQQFETLKKENDNLKKSSPEKEHYEKMIRQKDNEITGLREDIKAKDNQIQKLQEDIKQNESKYEKLYTSYQEVLNTTVKLEKESQESFSFNKFFIGEARKGRLFKALEGGFFAVMVLVVESLPFVQNIIPDGYAGLVTAVLGVTVLLAQSLSENQNKVENEVEITEKLEDFERDFKEKFNSKIKNE